MRERMVYYIYNGTPPYVYAVKFVTKRGLVDAASDNIQTLFDLIKENLEDLGYQPDDYYLVELRRRIA
jgi:hypothetical protein